MSTREEDLQEKINRLLDHISDAACMVGELAGSKNDGGADAQAKINCLENHLLYVLREYGE